VAIYEVRILLNRRAEGRGGRWGGVELRLLCHYKNRVSGAVEPIIEGRSPTAQESTNKRDGYQTEMKIPGVQRTWKEDRVPK